MALAFLLILLRCRERPRTLRVTLLTLPWQRAIAVPRNGPRPSIDRITARRTGRTSGPLALSSLLDSLISATLERFANVGAFLQLSIILPAWTPPKQNLGLGP